LSRTFNALNALVSSEQVRFKQTSESVFTDGRVPDGTRLFAVTICLLHFRNIFYCLINWLVLLQQGSQPREFHHGGLANFRGHFGSYIGIFWSRFSWSNSSHCL